MKRTAFFTVALMFLAILGVYAKVEVTNIEDNKGGTYKAGVMEEGGLLYHDRNYTIENVPEEFLGLTQIMASANCPGGLDYRLTFEIDRSAFVYTAWDVRPDFQIKMLRPEERGQDPENWFNDNFYDTGKKFAGMLNQPWDYLIYRSNNRYPEGKVELKGIGVPEEDPILMWTIFLSEEGDPVTAVKPIQKLTATWAKIKL